MQLNVPDVTASPRAFVALQVYTPESSLIACIISKATNPKLFVSTNLLPVVEKTEYSIE